MDLVLTTNYNDGGNLYRDAEVLSSAITPRELRQLIIELMDQYGATYHSSEIEVWNQTRRTYAESLRKADELNRIISDTEREMEESRND